MTSWSRHPDSNRGPTHYECVALPTEPGRPTAFQQDWSLARKASAKLGNNFYFTKFCRNNFQKTFLRVGK